MRQRMAPVQKTGYHRAAGPPANTSYRSAGMACSRWSRIFVKNFTIFEVSGTERFAVPSALDNCRESLILLSGTHLRESGENGRLGVLGSRLATLGRIGGLSK